MCVALLPAARRSGESNRAAQRSFGAQDVTAVRTVFDLAANALPVLLERIVPLDDRLQLEAFCGVPNLDSPQLPNAPIDVFARNRWLDALEAHEVLLVERAQPFHTVFEFFDGAVDLGGRHGSELARGL